MGKGMRHTLGASLNIRHNLSSSKGPKPLQLKLLTTYIPKTSAFTLAFSTSQRLRTTRADRKSGSAGMPRPISYAVFCLKKKKNVPCKYIGTSVFRHVYRPNDIVHRALPGHTHDMHS